MTEASNLQGKRVLVTGGAGGVGRATAQRLVAAGARVMITDLYDDALQGVVAELESAGHGQIKGVAADLAEAGGVTRMWAAADAWLGGLDMLVACTGIGSAPLMELDDAGWRRVINTNLMSYVACTAGAIERIKAAGIDDGMIILVGSISVHIKAIGESVYNAAKGGVASFAETLRKELMAERIRLTLIEPGAIGTHLQPYGDAQLAQFVEKYEMLPASEVAEAILFAATRGPGVDVVTLRIEPLHQKIC
jgi:NAD(P)-dependent dehydrogenase (short-subunit alcohol dehydrogenase family)